MLKKMLLGRKLPGFLEREEMLEILQREEYGYLPPKPDKISFETEDVKGAYHFCAGKAVLKKIWIITEIKGKEFRFPAYSVIPTKEGPHPFFVHINFRPDVPDKYMPTEEIVDNGFATLSFGYNDVTTDDNDFTNGFAGVLYPEGIRKNSTDPGKIAMWAWAAHRLMDYAETNPLLDASKAFVCGHSRLGKTALLAAATDTRFALAYSNDSGCSGAAITRDKVGEDVFEITKRFPYWFCENYWKYQNLEHKMPFDQHFLMASVAPRNIYVASAVEDTWADPSSEFLNCVLTSEVFESQGHKGFVHHNRLPEGGEVYHDGDIGYHLREGQHYFSREDWNKAMEYIKKTLL